MIIERATAGWRLSGSLQVAEPTLPANLHYRVECDQGWRTRSALIEGEAGGRPTRFVLTADGTGHWNCNGSPMPSVVGAIDVDLGFTPATNTLPIRRLGLGIGEHASVRSAWLRFPQLRLEPLQQTYHREAQRVFRYHALVNGDPFVARLDVDGFGRVVRYEGLWEADRENEEQHHEDEDAT